MNIEPAAATEELSNAVAKQTSTNFATSEGLASILRLFDRRSISIAPAKAASKVPIAINPASKGGTTIITLVKKDPARIAGQIRCPLSMTSASANPVGGHNGVTIGLTAGSNCAHSARTKQTHAIATNPTT